MQCPRVRADGSVGRVYQPSLVKSGLFLDAMLFNLVLTFQNYWSGECHYLKCDIINNQDLPLVYLEGIHTYRTE